MGGLQLQPTQTTTLSAAVVLTLEASRALATTSFTCIACSTRVWWGGGRGGGGEGGSCKAAWGRRGYTMPRRWSPPVKVRARARRKW